MVTTVRGTQKSSNDKSLICTCLANQLQSSQMNMA